MNAKLKLAAYAIVVFIVYMVLVWALRSFSGKLPIEDGFWGIYKDSDFLLGLAVTFFVTLSHHKRRKLK